METSHFDLEQVPFVPALDLLDQADQQELIVALATALYFSLSDEQIHLSSWGQAALQLRNRL